MHDTLIIPTVPHTLDCFNTDATLYSNGQSYFHLAPSETMNNLFVAGVFSYIYKVCNTYDDEVYIINSEGLREFLTFSRGGKSRDIRQDLNQLALEQCVIGEQTYPLAEVSHEGRLTIIRSLYFRLLSVSMRENAIRPDGTEGSRYTSLVHSDICKVKSKPSAEVCIELCKLIERRGSHNAPAHINIKTLVTRCHSLRTNISTAPTISRKNKILRDAVEKGVELIKTATSTYDYYEKVEISLPEKISIVDDGAVITITHQGRK